MVASVIAHKIMAQLKEGCSWTVFCSHASSCKRFMGKLLFFSSFLVKTKRKHISLTIFLVFLELLDTMVIIKEF